MKLATDLIERLSARRRTLAVAESCTGGLLAGRITAVPGASRVFVGGVVAYANEAKRRLLRVPARTLASAGAVSSATAHAMARGARRRLRADLAAAVTGVAGPSGGSPRKPVGLVFVAVADGRSTTVVRHQFEGDRDAIRRQACDAALRLLLERATA